MRRTILLIMAFCYLASATGVAVQWHYCMGKLRSIDFSSLSHSERCSKCGMQKKENSCCNDAVAFSKVTDAHQQTGALAYNPLSASDHLPECIHSVASVTEAIFHPAVFKISPPPLLKPNRSVLFCVFRC